MRLHGRLLAPFAAVLLLAGSAGAAEWHVPADFATIQDAIDSSSVKDGDAIVVEPGAYAGATVTKAVTIRASAGASIVDGPVVSAFGKAGFFFPGGGQGSGATITGFSFVGIPLPVFSRGADDVTVNRNSLSWFLQGITNWGYGSWGHRWEIADNTMYNLTTSCGGGIGVLVGDYQGGTLTGNSVVRNSIRGRLRVASGDCGGYNAPGITLYADFRGGAAGAVLQANVVSKNTVVLKGATPVLGGQPLLVTVSGIEISDTRDDGLLPAVITDNAVIYNDLRLMDVPFSSNPDELTSANTIENNYSGSPQFLPDRGLMLARRPAAAAVAVAAPSPIR
jgi:hypothetical protein